MKTVYGWMETRKLKTFDLDKPPHQRSIFKTKAAAIAAPTDKSGKVLIRVKLEILKVRKRKHAQGESRSTILRSEKE